MARIPPGHSNVGVRPQMRHPVGDVEPRRGVPGNFGEQIEDLLKGEVLAPQNVALADAAAFRGLQVPRGHVVDIDKIQAGVHVAEHPPVEEIHDNLPGGRGLKIFSLSDGN